MVGISPVSQGARSNPPQTRAPGLAELARDSCAVESAWHYKGLSPRCIIRKEGGKMAAGIIQFLLLHGVFELHSPAVCSSQ